MGGEEKPSSSSAPQKNILDDLPVTCDKGATIPCTRNPLSDKIKICKTKTNSKPMPPPLSDIPFFYILLGPPGCGKTNMWQNLINNKDFYRKQFHQIHVFSNSAHTLDPKEVGIPKERLHEGFDPVLIQSLMDKDQDELRREVCGGEDDNDPLDNGITPVNPYCAQRIRSYPESLQGVHPHNQKVTQRRKRKKEYIHRCFIFDDVVADLNRNEGWMIRLLYNRRHKGISVIFVTQKFRALSLEYRTVVNSVFVWEPVCEKECLAVYEEYSRLPRPAWNTLCREVWSARPHNFLLIRFDTKHGDPYRFYSCFDRLEVFNDDSTSRKIERKGNMKELLSTQTKEDVMPRESAEDIEKRSEAANDKGKKRKNQAESEEGKKKKSISMSLYHQERMRKMLSDQANTSLKDQLVAKTHARNQLFQHSARR